MNKTLLIGRLVADPELKLTNGSRIAKTTFTIAVDREFENAEGKKEADYIRIVTWRKLAENMANNLAKGRLVAVSGSIRTGSYQGQDGKKVYTTEVYADTVKYLDKPRQQSDTEQGGQWAETEDFVPMHDDTDIPF